jgi:23S rRNA (cytosine1962-C5)-methyltransferase
VILGLKAVAGPVTGEKRQNINSRIDLQAIISERLREITPYLSNNKITAYRLINDTRLSLPVTVDIYQDNAVVHVFSAVDTVLYQELERALKQTLSVNAFFYKKNSKEDFAVPESPTKKIIQDEYGCQFLLNLSDYLDTGLFLDHRETRRWIGGLSRHKTVLNTFAYTGSFSVYAAAAGALKTHSVDISSVYCEWTKENMAVNKLSLEQNWVYKMDTLEFFHYAKRKNLIFDIIIIDPPTFSNNKGKTFSVQKDHPRLINSALELLSSSGFILFSNNYREFRLSDRDLLPCTVSEKLDTLPPDFSGTQPHRCFIIKKNAR